MLTHSLCDFLATAGSLQSIIQRNISSWHQLERVTDRSRHHEQVSFIGKASVVWLICQEKLYHLALAVCAGDWSEISNSLIELLCLALSFPGSLVFFASASFCAFSGSFLVFSASASFSAFFFSRSNCLQFSSWERTNNLTKFWSVMTTGKHLWTRYNLEKKKLMSVCSPKVITELKLVSIQLEKIEIQCKFHLAQMDNVLGLLQNKVLMHQHFFPADI